MFLAVTKIPDSLFGESLPIASIGAELAERLAYLLKQPQLPNVERLLQSLDEREPYWRRYYA
jgi:hypothetical protein